MTARPFITCRQLIEFIMDYVAGELGDDERSDFERHLEHCASCQAYLDSYRKTMVLAVEGDKTADDVPEELVRTILKRVK